MALHLYLTEIATYSDTSSQEVHEMKKVFGLTAVLTLLLTLSHTAVYAQSTTRARLIATDHLAALTERQVLPKKQVIHAYVNGLGRLRFYFNDIQQFDGITTLDGKVSIAEQIVNLKGWAMHAGKPLRAAATVAKNGAAETINISFFHTARRTQKVTFYRLAVERSNTTERVHLQRTKQVHLDGKHCGAKPHSVALRNHSLAPSPSNERAIAASTNLKELELSVHVDARYVQLHGSGTSNIQSRLNEAEAFYENDLGVTYKIVRVAVDSGLNFSSDETSVMLQEFADYIDSRGYRNSADAFHLFSGRDLKSNGNSNTIGIAYQGLTNDVGVICRPNLFFQSFGIRPATVAITERLSQATDGQVSLTVAHELGHNFSANHSNAGIMSASLGPTLPSSFSSASISEIQSYINKHGSCLASVSEPTPTPNPNPTAEPTNTPTPGGGSGGNGSGGSGSGGDTSDRVSVDLAIALSRSGQFSATITLAEEAPENCQFQLRMGTKKNKIGSARVLASAPAEALTTTFSAAVSAKALKRNKKGKKQKVWAVGELLCSDAPSGVSEPRRVKAHRVRTRKGTLAKGWIRQLKKALRN